MCYEIVWISSKSVFKAKGNIDFFGEDVLTQL
jgi:hypothetical protein